MNRISALLLCGAAIASPSLAQLPAGMTMPNLDYFPILLLDPRVQRDMHVSPAVAQKVMTATMEMGMSLLPELSSMGPKATPQQKKLATAKILQVYSALEKKAIAPLTHGQRVRLHQLTLQYYGPSALLQPNIRRQVGLTSAQSSRLRGVLNSVSHDFVAAMKGIPASDYQRRMQLVNRQTVKSRLAGNRAIAVILTPSQKRKWAAMQGRPMPGITKLSFGPGMFGGGR